jgi:hypothetical protein
MAIINQSQGRFIVGELYHKSGNMRVKLTVN